MRGRDITFKGYETFEHRNRIKEDGALPTGHWLTGHYLRIDGQDIIRTCNHEGCCPVNHLVVPGTVRRSTGLLDADGGIIFVGDRVKLELDSGEVRIFDVVEDTVVRDVRNYPGFANGWSKVAITGIVFKWEGYSLFPCVDKDGLPDNRKMHIIGTVFDAAR